MWNLLPLEIIAISFSEWNRCFLFLYPTEHLHIFTFDLLNLLLPISCVQSSNMVLWKWWMFFSYFCSFLISSQIVIYFLARFLCILFIASSVSLGSYWYIFGMLIVSFIFVVLFFCLSSYIRFLWLFIITAMSKLLGNGFTAPT